ncbi:MAG: type VI secretion system baseplate subunit TssG, partial [Prolixibacteraceae bacterium]|nr:type VI secretion system baseplate subunit TssG [Prolixibacteraceae bacterium]
ISSTEIENFENGDQALSLHLNRAGIYDALPESLFHTFSENRNATGEDMARESMKLKGEEKDARLFFRPLENEIFFHHVRVSLQENKELYKIYSEFINGLSPGFWRVDKRVQSKYSIRIIKLLPYVHRIMGNYDLTAQCLENVLDEKVSMQIEYDEPEKEEVIRAEAAEPVVNYNELGKSKLGFNMVIGHSVSGFVARVTVKIGPLQNTALKEFFPEGKADLALKCFYSYFIPVEFDVETKLVMQKQRNKLVLGCSSEEESEKSFLGFNTVI